jgi:hypothetical protein
MTADPYRALDLASMLPGMSTKHLEGCHDRAVDC